MAGNILLEFLQQGMIRRPHSTNYTLISGASSANSSTCSNNLQQASANMYNTNNNTNPANNSSNAATSTRSMSFLELLEAGTLYNACSSSTSAHSETNLGPALRSYRSISPTESALDRGNYSGFNDTMDNGDIDTACYNPNPGYHTAIRTPARALIQCGSGHLQQQLPAELSTAASALIRASSFSSRDIVDVINVDHRRRQSQSVSNNLHNQQQSVAMAMQRTLEQQHQQQQQQPATGTAKKKRKRTRTRKNSEEMESQRMTHIAVERNRRRQMNEHLSALRNLMPSSYIQRGDQASIVGGAIRFVEELEQVVQWLRLQKQLRGHDMDDVNLNMMDDSSLYYRPPQQVGTSITHLEDVTRGSLNHREEAYACSKSLMATIEVKIASPSTILLKVLAQKQPRQLLQMLSALNKLFLKVVHLNITTIDLTILYSLNLEMEEDCRLQSPAELAESIQHIFGTYINQSI